MNDAGIKRRMKWHTEGSYIDTDMARAVAIKKTLENMDRDSLRLLLNASYGMTPAYDAILAMMVLQELQRRKKEEKKMENKVKDLFKITMDGETQQTISIFDNGVDPAWFEFEYDSAFKEDAINSLLHYIESMGIGVQHIHTINGCFSHHKIRYVTKDVTKDILTMLKRLGVFGDVTKHTIRIEDIPSGVTGKLRIGRGKFGFGVTRNELAPNRGAIYYYLPENRDPTVLEFKNGKYVRGDNDGGLTTFTPFNQWRSIFGDDRFYETWAEVKDAVVEAINDRKIYVNVPCIPDLIEEDCYIDD